MSDTDVSDSSVLGTTMRGQSRLIVVLGDAQTIKESAKKIKALGNIVRVARGVFLIHGQLIKSPSVLHTLPTIFFQKAREIPSVSERGEDASSRRVYAVISYRFKNPTAIQKKRVERLVRKSISIRLRPGVLLFPVLKSKDRRRILESDETNKLMSSRRVSEELRVLGADVSRWTRLKLMNNHSNVHDAVVRTLSQDISYIETLAKDLRTQAKAPDAQLTTLRKRYSILSRRYRELKIKWSLSNKVWNYDAVKLLTRAYNLVIAARRAIEASTWDG